MKYYNMSVSEVLESLQTTEDGLTLEEAINRSSKYGLNILDEKKKTSAIKSFLNQFNDAMIIILLITAVITFV